MASVFGFAFSTEQMEIHIEDLTTLTNLEVIEDFKGPKMIFGQDTLDQPVFGIANSLNEIASHWIFYSITEIVNQALHVGIASMTSILNKNDSLSITYNRRQKTLQISILCKN